MVEDIERERIVEELALLLLYLTSWEEELTPGAPIVRRAWKNVRFDILDSLVEHGYLTTSHRAKSVGITKEGIRRAEELKKKYLP